jgi:hypothetical protein
MYKNLTPHDVALNDGRAIPKSGDVARLEVNYLPFDGDICVADFGRPYGLPDPQRVCRVCLEIADESATGRLYNLAKSDQGSPGGQGYCGDCHVFELVIYIVSGLVAQAPSVRGRSDVVSPATGHPDAKRNSAGQIVSVPGFVRA